MTVRHLLLLSFLAGLTGCASDPAPVTYYLLAPPLASADGGSREGAKQTLVIEQVEIAAYLRQSGLVLQSGENQLVVSKSHLWAESLDQALPKALLKQLQQKSRDYEFYLKAADYVEQTDYRLRLHVDSLQATNRGEVVTAGRFQLISNADTAHPVSRDFYFRRDLDDDGYAHAVEQMQALVGDVADAVIEAMKRMSAIPDNAEEL